MIKYIQIIAVFLLLLPVTSQGQTRKKFLEAAETAYSSGNFYAALVYYNEVLAFDEKMLILFLNLLKPRENLIPMLLQQKNMRC
ncbi:MAG: hypothetical protein IPP37_02345 [Saprospiraceae bacterium]|nr:hypothetical protein [Saprospiraceae bacterium]